MLPSDFWKILSMGAIQFGFMYSLFQASFFFLNGHEVALLLIPTTAYVLIIGNIFSKNWDCVRTAMAAAMGLSAVFLMDFSQKFCFKWQGVLLTQGCNFSFALGQVLVRRFCEKRGIRNPFFLNAALYAGAAAVCVPLALCTGNGLSCAAASGREVINAMLFGVICCGICHWFWNMGALKTGIHTLAAMNNFQIPLAIVISCTIFGEKIDAPRFIGSAAILAIIGLSSTIGRHSNAASNW
jgi:drug/metabolite transporter (DMT)-like permease